MKAYEFPVPVTADGHLNLPDNLRRILQAHAVVRILVLVDEPAEMADDEAWPRLGAEQLLARHGDSDDIYDRVP